MDNTTITPEGEKSSKGALIGTIIIIILLILGGIYMAKNRGGNGTADINIDGGLPTDGTVTDTTGGAGAGADAGANVPLSDSDAVSDIQADLNATDVQNVDSGLNQ